MDKRKGVREAPSARSVVDLLDRCRKQDEDAWAEFRPWFRRVAWRILTGFPALSPLEREEIEDGARVAVALAISEGRIRAGSDGEAVSYVRTVVTNAARDAWQRRRAEIPLPERLQDGGASPQEQVDLASRLACVEKEIGSWSPDSRFIFMMKLEQVSTAGIKQDLERLFGVFVTTEAVDVRYFRLRSALRRACLDGG